MSLLCCSGAVLALGLGFLGSPPTTVTAAPLGHPAPIQQRSATTVTTEALPTAQLDNGVAWTLKIVGATVYAGGTFRNARPAGAAPGTGLVPRHNLLAFDLASGVLTPFAPDINGTVRALATSPDGSRLYVGGSFTTVDGKPRKNIAAFSTATGALLDAFRPTAGGIGVFALAATDSTVYVGGLLRSGNGVARKNLMAFDAGGRLMRWAPRTDKAVEAMVLNPSGSKLIIGGRFYTVDRAVRRGMAALSPVTGGLAPWAATAVIKNAGKRPPYINKAGIWSLSTDGTAVFGTGWAFSGHLVGNLEGAFSLNPETGAVNWIEDCHGDSYASYSDTTTVYVAGHPHDCESVGGYPQKDGVITNTRYALAFTADTKGTLWRSPRLIGHYKNWEGRPAPAMLGWFPDFGRGSVTGQGQSTWAMAGTGEYLVVGGEFPTVNGQTQAGLVRFARPTVQPAHGGPTLVGTSWIPTLRSLGSGTVRVSLPANVDRDDLSLTYAITRADAALPVHTATLSSTFWSRPMLGFLDTGLHPGTRYTYQVTATDPDGNVATSAPASITVPSSTAPVYANRVLADGASLYWRLGDDGGSADVVANDNGVNRAGVTESSTSALGTGTGYRVVRAGGGTIGGSLRKVSPDEFSVEAWFRTTTTGGGRLFGFGPSPSRTSRTDDRQVYLSRAGRLVFGIRQNNVRRVITTAGAYTDGRWHHVVATESSAGAALYVDGVLVGSDAGIVNAQDYYGYWRLGGGVAAGWPNRGTRKNYFVGELDEFAVYPSALTAAQVQAHATT